MNSNASILVAAALGIAVGFLAAQLLGHGEATTPDSPPTMIQPRAQLLGHGEATTPEGRPSDTSHTTPRYTDAPRLVGSEGVAAPKAGGDRAVMDRLDAIEASIRELAVALHEGARAQALDEVRRMRRKAKQRLVEIRREESEALSRSLGAGPAATDPVRDVIRHIDEELASIDRARSLEDLYAILREEDKPWFEDLLSR